MEIRILIKGGTVVAGLGAPIAIPAIPRRCA